MRHARVAGALEDAAEGVDVVAQVGGGILQRVPDARLRAATGFAPRTPLALGLSRFVDWYRDYYR